MTEWKPQIGRITLLPVAPLSSPPISALELYRRVWGAEPDGFQKQSNPLLPALAYGKRGDLSIRCVTQPTRIDLDLTPPQPSIEERSQASLPLIEDASHLHAELLRIMEMIGQEVIGSVARVALNLQFLAPQGSFREANRALTAVIPDQYRIKLTDEEEFILQISRPQMSRTAADIKMNYITKWSVDRIQLLTLAIPVGGMPVNAPLNISTTPRPVEFIAADVTFDFNNAPMAIPLSGRQQSSLLLETLTAVAELQQAYGLNVEGFQSVKLSR